MPALDKVEALNDEAVGVNILRRALEEPLRQIAINAGQEGSVVVDAVRKMEPGNGYDAQKGEYADMFAAGIIDPAKVTRSALENAASIAALMLTTEAVITDIPEKEKADARHAARRRDGLLVLPSPVRYEGPGIAPGPFRCGRARSARVMQFERGSRPSRSGAKKGAERMSEERKANTDMPSGGMGKGGGQGIGSGQSDWGDQGQGQGGQSDMGKGQGEDQRQSDWQKKNEGEGGQESGGTPTA